MSQHLSASSVISNNLMINVLACLLAGSSSCELSLRCLHSPQRRRRHEWHENGCQQLASLPSTAAFTGAISAYLFTHTRSISVTSAVRKLCLQQALTIACWYFCAGGRSGRLRSAGAPAWSTWQHPCTGKGTTPKHSPGVIEPSSECSYLVSLSPIPALQWGYECRSDKLAT